MILPENSSSVNTLRRRLDVLQCAAKLRRPTVWGTYQLHTRWRELEQACAGNAELRRLHRQVDQALGGHRQLGGGR